MSNSVADPSYLVLSLSEFSVAQPKALSASHGAQNIFCPSDCHSILVPQFNLTSARRVIQQHMILTANQKTSLDLTNEDISSKLWL